MDSEELNRQLANLSEEELLSLPVIHQWLQRNALSFRIDAIPDDWADDANMELTNLRVRVNRRSDGRWGVIDRLDEILDSSGQWRESPVPYEDLDSVRWPLAEAIARAREAVKPLRHFNMTPEEYIQWLQAPREARP